MVSVKINEFRLSSRIGKEEIAHPFMYYEAILFLKAESTF